MRYPAECRPGQAAECVRIRDDNARPGNPANSYAPRSGQPAMLAIFVRRVGTAHPDVAEHAVVQLHEEDALLRPLLPFESAFEGAPEDTQDAETRYGRPEVAGRALRDRKSTRLNSSH